MLWFKPSPQWDQEENWGGEDKSVGCDKNSLITEIKENIIIIMMIKIVMKMEIIKREKEVTSKRNKRCTVQMVIICVSLSVLCVPE